MNTDEFDWTGAPEGERWTWHGARFIINDQRAWINVDSDWRGSANTPDIIRANGTRVESARPVPRVGDRVRISVEGVVGAVYGDNLDLIAADGRRETFLLTAFDPVEVLERADPLLQPGDLVRDGNGFLWRYEGEGQEKDRAFTPSFGMFNTRRRDELTGPLVKVQLTEVPDA